MQKYTLNTSSYRIELQEIEKEDVHFFYINGFKYAKVVNWIMLFDSYDAAKDVAIQRLQQQIKILHQKTDALKAILNHVKDGESKR
jgi:hypothetical protein